MSNYTRQQIQSLIARTKKRNNTSKSPTSQLSPKQPKVKRTNSPTTSFQSNSSKDLTLRYQQLHTKYKQLLQEVKDKNHQFQLQQMELTRLKSQRQRDQKQLYRMRMMIGFIKKQDYGMQVNMDMQSGGSWNTKVQKSTTIDVQHDIQAIYNTASKNYQNSSNFTKKYPNSPPKQATSTLYIQNVNNNRSAKNIHIKDYGFQEQSFNARAKAESIYSPKTNQKQLSTIYKLKQSRQVDSKGNKLSNSPYSRLRFSRNFN